MIQSIRELVEFFQKESNTKSYGAKLNTLTGKKRALYDLLVLDDSLNEDQIFEQLYEGKNNRKTFLKLQERLLQNLIDIIFFSTNTNKSIVDVEQIRLRCIKQTALLKILLFKGLPINVQEASRNLINVCRRYEYHDLLTEILFLNLDLYGRAYQDKKKFNKYAKLYNEINALNQLEREVQLKYNQYFIDFATTQLMLKSETLDRLQADEAYFSNILDQETSFRNNYFAYNALSIINEIKGSYQNIVVLADEALQYMQDKPQNNIHLQLSFLQKKFRAQVKLQDSNNVFNTLEEIEKRVIRFSVGYYGTTLYKCLMWSHQDRYEEVVQEILDRSSAKDKKYAPPVIMEYLQVVYAYMAFLAEAEIFESATFANKKFRVFRFLNQVPIYSRDKRGVNVAILILHVLFLLSRRKYDQIIDRVEALKLYSYRYLRKDDSFRSNCFIRMIIEMSKSSFHPIRTERNTSKLFDRLKSVPLKLSEQPLEVEIIPYEKLWEIVMQLLEKNSQIRRGRPKKELIRN